MGQSLGGKVGDPAGIWSLVAPLRLRSLPPLGERWESWLMRGGVSTKPWKLPRSHTFLAHWVAMIAGVYVQKNLTLI